MPAPIAGGLKPTQILAVNAGSFLADCADQAANRTRLLAESAFQREPDADPAVVVEIGVGEEGERGAARPPATCPALCMGRTRAPFDGRPASEPRRPQGCGISADGLLEERPSLPASSIAGRRSMSISARLSSGQT